MSPTRTPYAIGYAAYADGIAAPALHPEIRRMTEHLPVGAGAADIYREYTRGYQQAADDTLTQ